MISQFNVLESSSTSAEWVGALPHAWLHYIFVPWTPLLILNNWTSAKFNIYITQITAVAKTIPRNKATDDENKFWPWAQLLEKQLQKIARVAIKSATLTFNVSEIYSVKPHPQI